MNAFFVSAADQVITWKKEAQEIDLYSDEALKIQWTGTHDVWLHDAAGCAGGESQMAPEADSNWSAIGRKRSRGNALFKLQSWKSLRRKHDVEGNLPRRIETGHDDDDHFLREKERSIRDRVRSISGRFRALLLTCYILEHVRARTPHTARDERSDLCKRTLRKERTTTKILTTMQKYHLLRVYYMYNSLHRILILLIVSKRPSCHRRLKRFVASSSLLIVCFQGKIGTKNLTIYPAKTTTCTHRKRTKRTRY